MSRKKKTILTGACAAMLIAVVALVGIFNRRSYTHSIPERAKAVVRIDPSEIASPDQATGMLHDVFGISPEGIDFASPLYAFVTPNDLVGFTAALSDAPAFGKAVDEMAKKKSASALGESDGRNWAWLTGGWMLSWSKKDLLILGPGTAAERDVLKQTMRRMTESSSSFEDTETFEKLSQMSGGIQLFADISTLPSPYGLLFKLNLPTDLPSESVSLFAAVDMGHSNQSGNKITANCTLEGNTDEVNASIAQFEKSLCTINSATKAVTDNHLFSLVTSTSGTSFLKLLHTDGTLRSLLVGLNQTIDATRMLGSVDGLLTLHIDSLDAEWNPTFCLKGQTARCDLTADAGYWMESVRGKSDVELIREGETAFRLTAKGQTLHFGVDARQGMLYFASPSMLPDVAQANVAAPEADNGEEMLTHFCLNTEKLYAQPCLQTLDGIAAMLQKLLPATKRITYRALRGGHATLTFE